MLRSSVPLFLAPLVPIVLALHAEIPANLLQDPPFVPRSIVGLSIEQDRWLEWSGTTERNQFFNNVLDNLRQLSGEPVPIRIGANSQDNTQFNPAIEFAQTEFPPPTEIFPYQEADSIVVGDGFYQATQFLPPGTPVTWGINLGANNATVAFLMTRSIVRAFQSAAVRNSGITLDFLEIGNEPDFFRYNGHRPSTYSVQDFVSEWERFAANVSAAAGLTTNGRTRLWVPSFLGASHSTQGFSPQAIFALGLLDSTPGRFVGTISQHHYSGAACSGSDGLLQDLMTKSSIRSNLTQYSPDIAATHERGLPYIFGETNSHSCHGSAGVSNSAGAAIWALDYTLQAASLGVSRLFWHEGIGYKYNLIQPVSLNISITDASPLPQPLPPHVQPQYYSAVIVSEVLGATTNPRVAEIAFDSSVVAGYAIFNGNTGQVARVVIINSDAFTTSDGGGRPRIRVTIGGVPGSGQARLKRLAIGRADDTSGLTWGGQTYETPDGRPSGEVVEEIVNVVTDGFILSATEALTLTFI